jgi:hypothetical protein
MSDNRESVDRFGKYFRQRLKTYPVVPDENCWNEIEARLQKKRRRSPLWLGLPVAASVLAAVFIFHHLPEQKDPDRKENAAYRKEYPTEPPVTTGMAMDKRNTDTGDEPVIAAVRTPAGGKQTPAFVGEAGTEPDIDGQEAPVAAGGEQQEATEKKTPEEAETRREPGTEKPYRAFENRTVYDRPDKNKRNNKRWQIAAGFSSVGRFLSPDIRPAGNMPGDPPLMFSPGEGDGDYAGRDNPEDPGKCSKERITDVKPSVSFSAGVTVRRKWNKTLGIETGFVYTRLSSDLRIADGNDGYDAVLDLHYLGVPANLTVHLWEKNRVNLYASGGGMVEKGLRSVCRQTTPVYDDTWHDFMKKGEINRISGLQWSLNSGLGIAYHFLQEMNLYIEPGISYYFDCNQPVSKRTEDPLSFSLRVGIRYDF